MEGKEVEEAQRHPGALDERLYVASLEKGLKILEAMAGPSAALSLGEIAEATGYGKSAVQRFVYTLVRLGYLRKEVSGRRYRLTSKLYLVGSRSTSAAALVRDAEHQLISLNAESGETTALSIAEGMDIVVLAAIPGRHIHALNVQAGMRFPLLSSSSGLAMAATWGEDELARVLPRSPKDAKALRERLGAVRSAGFCVTENSIVTGHVSISAPVVDASGCAVAAVNISTLAARFPVKKAVAELAPLTIAAAKAVSGEIDRPGDPG